MHHIYTVHTGREKFEDYLRDVSPLRLVDGLGKAEVELSMEGVVGYFTVLRKEGGEITNIPVRLANKDGG